ncbi:MAG: Flp family type IVb pilin [Beijerinckiaceae bacterium]|nr:Flp family type IVb pilin [Beijerinckiaceae bacterium]
MDSFVALTTRYLRDERGATAIEYCLIASFISLVIVAGATLIGQTVLGFFQAVASGFQ